MISLLAFIQTGRLGEIGLGSTRTEVELAFGPPDAWDTRFHFPYAPSWKYGDIEFRFDYERLCTIICERFDVPEMGVPLDPWRIKRGASLEEVESWLTEANVSFTQCWYDARKGIDAITCLQSRVTFGFTVSARGGLSTFECS